MKGKKNASSQFVHSQRKILDSKYHSETRIMYLNTNPVMSKQSTKYLLAFKHKQDISNALQRYTCI
jgi:hypothetical protein